MTGSLTKIAGKNNPLLVLFLPILVLLTGFTSSYLIWNKLQNDDHEKLITEFENDASRITQNIKQRLVNYEIALTGLQGFFHGSEHIDRQEFKIFVDTMALSQNYPGIQGIGLAILVPHSEKLKHIKKIRTEGYPNYDITPKFDADFYVPIIYMEPFVGKNLKVLGLDVNTIPAARENLIRARDTGKASISTKLILVQDSNNEVSFVMYLPVYKNHLPHESLIDKRANIIGWIDAPFRMVDFIKTPLKDKPKSIEIEIFDGSSREPKDLMFSSKNVSKPNEALSLVQTIRFNDRPWTFVYYLNTENKNFHWATLIFGFSLSVITALFILSLTSGRARAVRLANLITAKYRKSEHLVRAYFDYSRVGMATTSPEKKWIMVNDELCKMLGYSRQELLNMSWAEITHPEDLSKDLAYFDQFISREIDGYTSEKRFIRKNGSILYSHLSVRVIYKENGEIDFFVALLNDIGARTKAAEKLLASENRFRDIVNTVDGIVWEADVKTFQITFISEQVERLTGYTALEWKQPGFWQEKIHPEDRERVVKLTLESIENSHKHDLEYRFINKANKTIWLRDIVTVVMENDQPKYLRGLLIDISERELAKKAHSELERQLRQSQKMEALGTLAGGIAHDFNNILGIILGNAQILTSSIGNEPKSKKRIATIITAANRAADLVKQILAFSRASPGQLVPTDVGKVLYEAISMLRKTSDKNIDIRLVIDDELSNIMANENQLHQIIVNLFNNAVHALKNERGVIEISLKQCGNFNENNAFVCLCIKDSGVGIEDDNLQKIFDPFFTTHQFGEATGLGLAVVYGIVKSYGAEIKVESIIGKGTTFRIYFTAIEDDVMIANKDENSSVKGSGKILLVEDESLLQKVYQDFLQELGYTMVCADNGKQAMDYFLQDPDSFDFILTDFAMPEMNGKQLSKKLHELRPNLPIVMMTGFSEEMPTTDLDSLGIKNCIFKPVSLNYLSRLIKDLI